jgi:DNA-binding transcriptional LysR family regulator
LLDDDLVNLHERGVDAAVRIGWIKDETLVARKLGDVRAVLVAAPNYVRVRGIPTNIAELHLHERIGLSMNTSPARTLPN